MKKVQLQFPNIKDYRMKEGLNQLKINLSFCGKDIRVIMFTSSISGEGKSSVAFNFSNILTENGKRVLFVDCDLRKSVMVARYHIEGIDKGLSHYLSGQAKMEDVIYATKNPSLFFVASGPHTLDPTNLLDSDTFAEFIQMVKNSFDYIILDCPPVGLVIDAVIAGQYTDGAVLVIEHGKIKRKFLQKVVKQLERSEIRILGAVLNKVDESFKEYGRYDYKYDYIVHENRRKKMSILKFK